MRDSAGFAPASLQLDPRADGPGGHTLTTTYYRRQTSPDKYLCKRWAAAFCDDLIMHLVPADRRSRRMLEAERVCQALGGLADCGDITARAELFRTLGDPSRLTLLICIHRAGPISVTDLAVAADMNETTVSQALRLLRATGTVAAHRSGRIVRYQLTSADIGKLIDEITDPRVGSGHMHAAT